jgi:hypothetical protein
MDLDDKLPISGTTTTLIFLYRVPEKVAGRWLAAVPASVGAEDIELDFEQKYTRVSGVARIAGVRVPVTEGRIVGRKFSFTLSTANGVHVFEGEVIDGSARGMVKSGAHSARWRARRLAQVH